MKPYAVQSFRSDRGEVAACRVLKPGGEDLRTEVLSGTELTLKPEPGTLYRCGELRSLTLTDPPASGAWMLVFGSGETPTETAIPDSVLGLEDFAAASGAVYEINVLDGRALVSGWAADPRGGEGA